MHILKRFLLFILFGSMVVGCYKHTPDQSRVPILEVEGKFLYHDQLESMLPPNISANDSVQLVESYIKKWVTDILLYEHAKRNVTNKAEIDKLLEDYRKSLIIHQYQQNLVQQRLLTKPTEDELLNFYEYSKDQLRLKECVLKGVLLVLPAGAPKISDVKKWVRTGDMKSLELIEKYSLQHGLSYDYFPDRWVGTTEILKKIPVTEESLMQELYANRFFETQDSLKHYMLKVDSIKRIGDIEPFEIGKDKITNFIMNQRQAEFISNFEDELYDDAVLNGTVTFFK